MATASPHRSQFSIDKNRPKLWSGWNPSSLICAVDAGRRETWKVCRSIRRFPRAHVGHGHGGNSSFQNSGSQRGRRVAISILTSRFGQLFNERVDVLLFLPVKIAQPIFVDLERIENGIPFQSALMAAGIADMTESMQFP